MPQPLPSDPRPPPLPCTPPDLYLTYGDALLPLTDVGGPAAPGASLLAQLLLKAASGDKRFVVEEAQRALQVWPGATGRGGRLWACGARALLAGGPGEVIAGSTPARTLPAAIATVGPPPIQTLAQSLSAAQALPMLLPYCEHKNPKVRGRAAGAAEAAAARLDAAALAAIGLPELLRPAARLLTDNTPEAREAAKRLVPQLKAAFEDQGLAAPAAAAEGEEALAPGTWEAYCQATLGGSAALAVLKAC